MQHKGWWQMSLAVCHANAHTEQRAEAWLVGKEDEKVRLNAGDTIALPPDQPHVFRVAGDTTLRLLGTHISPQRIVKFDDGSESVMGTAEE